MEGSSQAELRCLVKAVVEEYMQARDVRQLDIAARIMTSQKHLSSVLNGVARMSLDMADKILVACGHRLELTAVPFSVVKKEKDH